MLKRVIALAIITTITLVTMSSSAHAAAPVQLINITPSSTAVKIDPGASKKGSVDVINKGDVAFDVSLSTSPYYVQGLNYDPHFTQLPGTVDASKWIQFNTETSQHLDAKTLLAIDYTITVPTGTPAGGYYAVIFAKTGADVSGQGIGAHGRVGDILYITVNGTIKTDASARGNEIPSIVNQSPVPLNIIVTNKGGTHFLSTVDITVKTLFGKRAFSYTADRYILPQTEREISTTWSSHAPVGIYRIERSATLPNGDTNLATKWVLVIQPWVIIALIAIIVVLVVLGLVNIRRGRRKRSS